MKTIPRKIMAGLLPPVHMQRYKASSGNTGVVAYTIGDDHIRIRFRDGRTYHYDYKATGKQNIEQMKKLAAAGKGLTTFINQHVRERYAYAVE